jgi:hypothetical protein
MLCQYASLTGLRVETCLVPSGKGENPVDLVYVGLMALFMLLACRRGVHRTAVQRRTARSRSSIEPGPGCTAQPESGAYTGCRRAVTRVSGMLWIEEGYD